MTAETAQASSVGAPRILLIGDETGARKEIEDHVRAEFRQLVISVLASTDWIGPDDHPFDLCIIAGASRAACLSAVKRICRRHPECPLLLVLELDMEELATVATAQGVDDYILKTPRYGPRLRAAVVDLIRSHEHRIKTLDSLKSSAQQFQDLVESSEQGILVQVDDRPVYANTALARTLGYDDPEALLALDSISDFMDGRALPRSRRSALQRPPEPASSDTSVFRARRKDGRLIWLEKRVNEVSWEGRLARLVSLTDITERLQVQNTLERHQAALQERVKELRCLYKVSNELARTDIEWREVLKNIVDAIPGGWQYPEAACARLRVEDDEVMTENFRATKWSISVDVCVGSEVVGGLEVFYTQEKPARDIGPFLDEERNLLDDMARRIGQRISTWRYQQELDVSRRRFRDFAEAASDWLWEMDENLRFTYFSDRIETVMGQPVSHWIGKSREELSINEPKYGPKWRRHRADLEARRPFRDFRYDILLPDGSAKHISISGVPIFDDVGRFRGYRGSGTDVTLAVEARDHAKESERRLQSVADRLPGIVFQRLRKPDGRIEYPYLSAGIDTILGHNAEEIQNDPQIWTNLVHPEDRRRFEVAIAGSSRTLEPLDIKFRMITRAGHERWFWHRSRARRLENGDTLWDCIELDITEQKKAEARARYLGYHDQLTGMANRDLFVERVNQILPIASRNQQTVAVAMLGLKRFKQVNEELGMAGGDEVLRVTAKRFMACLRPGDTVARLGGDRFLFLLPSVGQEPRTHKPFERLLQAMDQPFTIHQRQILVAFNMGIAVFPDDGDSVEELIQKADTAQAHYSRWGPGYGYAFYRNAMPASDTSRLALEKELNDAIESPEQIEAYFQPIYAAATGRLIAVEALARWMHPQRGLVPPGEFIQLAEDTGQINPLGLKILRQACVQARQWGAAAGRAAIVVAVNLSARQIRNPLLAASIKDILHDTGLAPHRLMLEVTENTLISDLDHATRFMEELVAEGVKFALDDFGVGYSSLSYLSRLPVQSLKIDRSFIRDLQDDPRGESTIKAVVALAHALELQVVAEGIETREQLEHVKRLGCDTLQGFFLGRPMPADDLNDLLCRHQALSVGKAPAGSDGR